jgi:hypothetical protein
MVDKFLQAKCRNILSEYGDVLLLLAKQLTEEADKEVVVGETSFEYAKKTIRKEGIKEGVKLFLNKINHNANER